MKRLYPSLDFSRIALRERVDTRRNRFCQGRNLCVFCEPCKHESYRISRQVHILTTDLSKAARHPIFEPRPWGGHGQRPDIEELSSDGRTTLFDSTSSHPVSAGRLASAPVVSNPLHVLSAAWTAKVSRFMSSIKQAGSG